MARKWRHYGAIWRGNGAIFAIWRHLAPYSAIKWRHMAPSHGVDGDKNGAPPLKIWQKQEMAPYGANGANGAIKWRCKWRHFYIMAAYGNGAYASCKLRHLNGAIWRHLMAPLNGAVNGAILNSAIYS